MSNKVTNTRNVPHPEWLMGGNPGAIEAQEKRGQEELTSKKDVYQLPREFAPMGDSRDELPKIGIEVIGNSNGDDLFYDVRLPEGWKIEPTAHSMWSNLVDENGTERAHIFYKAAFYDRKAFIRLTSKE